MGQTITENNSQITLDCLIYTDPKSLGAELDDFEACYSEWMKGALLSGQYPDGALSALTNAAVQRGGDPVTVVMIDRDNTRFQAFFIAYEEACNGDKVLRVPVLNWCKRISNEDEDAILSRLERFTAQRNCNQLLIHALPFQSRLRRAMQRRNAKVAGWVYGEEVLCQ